MFAEQSELFGSALLLWSFVYMALGLMMWGGMYGYKFLERHIRRCSR